MEHRADIAVIGGGFGGSLMAMVARQQGHSVVLIEKGVHPRFAIGESSTPLANLFLQQIAENFNLPQLLPFRRWGEWQRKYPEIGCGLKRGFSFFKHESGQLFSDDSDRSQQLLVAASPRDELADTHWFREEFDQHLVSEAQSLGVEYFDRTELIDFDESSDHVLLNGKRDKGTIDFRVGFVVDASGPRGCLFRLLRLSERNLPLMPMTSGLFAHFKNVDSLDSEDGVPYPVEDAAVHHVFDGGWVWVLKFNNGITSAGVAATKEKVKSLRLSEGAVGWDLLLNHLPVLAKQFRGADIQNDFVFVRELSFGVGEVVGKRWAILPPAAGFIDPLLSTGFALTLQGIIRLAKLLPSPSKDDLSLYQRQTLNELNQVSHLVGALYSSMDDFEVFTALTQLYFVAVSFAETANRLGKPDLANSFLLCDHPDFGESTREICELAVSSNNREVILRKISKIIEPFNISGLADASKRNWYPVVLDDLFRSAAKLESTDSEIREMLLREGML
jgi:FADH2 O2-dependent halogenase